MNVRHPLSRRRFFGGVATAMGVLGLRPIGLFAQGQTAQFRGGEAEYDAFAKLASNENNFGPPDNVMEAMNHAWKYANRYGYPDGDVVQEIAAHHGVKPENVLLTPGSGEVLEIVGEAFLMGNTKKVVGADPTYATVYQHATQIKAEGIKVPLLKNYQQDLDTMISEANKNASTVGLFYLCNPNNPTGIVISVGRRQAGGRGHPEDDADPDRRGLPPLRRRPGLRHLDPVRARGPAGNRRPHLLEDRGPGGDARRLRHLHARDHQAAARLRVEQRQRAGQARRRRVAQGHRRSGRGQEEDRRPAQQDHARSRGARLPGDPLADQLLHGQPARQPPCSRRSKRSSRRASSSAVRSRRC